jgi:hypothetical protein
MAWCDAVAPGIGVFLVADNGKLKLFGIVAKIQVRPGIGQFGFLDFQV